MNSTVEPHTSFDSASAFHGMVTQDITIGILKHMCQLLQLSFPGSTFGLDQSSEGGIEWTTWPGKAIGEQPETYKVLRLHSEGQLERSWHEDTDDNLVVYRKGYKLSACCKYYNNSPGWMACELRTFAGVLAVLGVNIVWTSLPSNRKLHQELSEC